MGSPSSIWQDLAGGRATRGTEAGGPQGASATQWWGEAEQAELRREVLASAEEGEPLYPHLSILHKVLHCIQNFLRTGNSQYLELQITERNGIERIVLKGDDDRLLHSVCHACGVPQFTHVRDNLWAVKEYTGLRPFCPLTRQTVQPSLAVCLIRVQAQCEYIPYE